MRTAFSSKGNCGYEPFIYSGEDSGHVFLKIEDILTIGKDSKDNFKVYSESISSSFSSKKNIFSCKFQTHFLIWQNS